jgi:frataxin-like iron-binding protein CyaY
MKIYCLVYTTSGNQYDFDYTVEQWVKYESYEELWDSLEKQWPYEYKPTIKIVEILDD